MPFPYSSTKKAVVSGGLLLLFTIFSLHQRRGSEQVALTPPSFKPTDQLTPSAPPTPTSLPDTNPTSIPPTATPTATPAGRYRDGSYTGISANAFYGLVQVRAVVSSGALSDVQFLSYPNDRDTSRSINSQATPWLRQEALQAQSAQVDVISGATDTSKAFIQSLNSALSQATL